MESKTLILAGGSCDVSSRMPDYGDNMQKLVADNFLGQNGT
jgi:hypothetical protein